jgi:hypothetical protein
LIMKKGMSRRKFFAPVIAGATAAAVAQPGGLVAAETSIPSIKIPKDVLDSLAEPAQVGSFEKGITGAEVFAKACKEEKLAAMFCCPGNYQVINAIAGAGIPSFGGRHEGSMASAADGFSRVTGEVTACSGTEGPGFTAMIMNIAVAHRARTPLLVLASNISVATDDTEYFIQTGYQQPTTEGLKKYGKRLVSPDRIHEYAGYAFRQLKTGVPGPVHLDFPSEVYRAKFTEASQLKGYYSTDKYRTESQPHPSPKDVAKAVDMINRSERPVIVAGQGVFMRKAWDALKTRSGEERYRGNHVRSDARSFSGRAPAVGESLTRRFHERRPCSFRWAVQHAQQERVPLQPRREVHSRARRTGRSRTQLAARTRHCCR